MALTVEDGTGLPNADSYIAIADADTYHADRGNAAWALLSSTVREQLLRKATDFMTQVYRERWAGTRVTLTQSLDWPRQYVPIKDAPGYVKWRGFETYYDSDIVPLQVARACAELALKASEGDLAADLEAQVKREKVGPLEVEYADGARQQPRFQAVDGMLAPFLEASGSQLKVLRA